MDGCNHVNQASAVAARHSTTSSTPMSTPTLTKSQIRKQNKLAWQRSLTVVVVDPSSNAIASPSNHSTALAPISPSCSQSLPSPPHTPSSTTASVLPSHQDQVAHTIPKDHFSTSLPPSPSSEYPPLDARSLFSCPSKRIHPYAQTPGHHPPQPGSRRQRAKRRREEQQAWQDEWFRVWSLNNLPNAPPPSPPLACQQQQPRAPPPPPPHHPHPLPPHHFSLSSYGSPVSYPHHQVSFSPSQQHQQLCHHDSMAWSWSSWSSLPSPFPSQQTPSPYP